jgi:hypothetical protein
MNHAENPPEEPTETRRIEVLLESLSKEFHSFGEGLIFVRDHVAWMRPKIEEIVERLTLVEVICRGNTDEIRKIEKNLSRLKGDVKKIDRRLAAVEVPPRA